MFIILFLKNISEVEISIHIGATKSSSKSNAEPSMIIDTHESLGLICLVLTHTLCFDI